MAGLKEIRRRIKSVKNTRKITYAMKLVSAAKLKKVQDALEHSRDYADALDNLLVQLQIENTGSSFSHPLLAPHESVKNVRLIVIGGTKGLCGPYNSNLNKKILETINGLQSAEAPPEILSTIVGNKPAEFYRRSNFAYSEHYGELSQDFQSWPIEEICTQAEQEFIKGSVDEVFLVFTRFRSVVSNQAIRIKLLPLETELPAEQKKDLRVPGITLYEPSLEEVFAAAIPRIFRTRVRQACLHSVSAEHGSRMSAMDAATKNAGELLDNLQLTHNKLRQAGITGEILDIIGGAVAV